MKTYLFFVLLIFGKIDDVTLRNNWVRRAFGGNRKLHRRAPRNIAESALWRATPDDGERYVYAIEL